MRRRIFIKQMTPAEAGNTRTHEKYVRLPNNFEHEIFFQHKGMINGSVVQIDFEAAYNGDQNDIIPLKFVYYANSNHEKRIPSLGPIFDKYNVTSSDIVYLESITDKGKTSFSISFKKESDVRIYTSPIFYEIEESANVPQNSGHDTGKNLCLQKIFYGAPGTGKSNKIEEHTNDKNRIRITFHPDSDYSTFVGAYKPTMEGTDDKLFSKGELINKLTEFKNSGVPYPVHKFATKYWRSLKVLNIADKKEILASCAMPDSYTVEFDKCIAIGEEYLKKSKETHIAYKYVPQAFLKAYVNAWNRMESSDDSPYYLVIEEINRGNCAQIFGDLFQLLDRGDNGESKYAISPDNDIRRYLEEQFINTTNIPETIKNGEEMRLPSNLYIWATMNTSDQSLFPIDSAFKRRWDWEYMPIERGDKDFVIEIGSKKYDWWDFISIINSKIDEITGSEDKKLGYWFAKPAGNGTIISCDQFVSKILFYLWNDVYKDYADDNRSIFRITDGNNSKKVAFTEFFGADKEAKLHAFMESNGITEIPSEAEPSENQEIIETTI